MMCTRCKEPHLVHNGHDLNGRERYKCNGCGFRPSERAGTFFYRHRFPEWIIRMAVLMHLKVPASTVKLFLFLLFRCRVSKKTICSWTKKFLDQLPEQISQPTDTKIIHADEKFFKIKREQAYWYEAADHAGTTITSLMSLHRDGAAAKQLFRQVRQAIEKPDIVVIDGHQSYIKAAHLFGRGCTHVVRGLKEKPVMKDGKLLFLSNLPVERANSKIDTYINLKVRGNFSTFESANRWRKAFMLTEQLQKAVAQYATVQHLPCRITALVH